MWTRGRSEARCRPIWGTAPQSRSPAPHTRFHSKTYSFRWTTLPHPGKKILLCQNYNFFYSCAYFSPYWKANEIFIARIVLGEQAEQKVRLRAARLPVRLHGRRIFARLGIFHFLRLRKRRDSAGPEFPFCEGGALSLHCSTIGMSERDKKLSTHLSSLSSLWRIDLALLFRGDLRLWPSGALEIGKLCSPQTISPAEQVIDYH